MVSPNWLGDAVMAFPAMAALRAAAAADDRIVVAAKPHVLDVWALLDPALDLLPLEPGVAGVRRAASALRVQACDHALILPRSMRAALPPWLARIPVRRGWDGGLRAALLTERVTPPHNPELHQADEVQRLAGVTGPPTLPPLALPDALRRQARDRLAAPVGPVVGLVPGASRGPAKRWPPEHFTDLAARLQADGVARVPVFGTAGEADACAAVAAAAGAAGCDLCGRTSLPELAALLACCDVVVANDSGGMHLAAAAGARVVALFGHTDPRKTGPLGTGHRILQAGDVRARRIARRDPGAEAALRALAPDRVHAAVREVLDA